MAEVEMKTLTCPGPPEHEFQIPKGRGRPPRYCDEHKPAKPAPKSNGKTEEKLPEQSSRPRPRPGVKSENGGETASRPRPRAPRVEPNEKGELDQPTPPAPDETRRRLPPPGRSDTGSRAKAENAAQRAVNTQPEDAVPRGIDGKPMAKIEFAASELIPTGQYANVTVGPVRITAYVDLARDSENGYFTKDEQETIVKAANELAELAEINVIGIQRNLVLESLQNDGEK